MAKLKANNVARGRWWGSKYSSVSKPPHHHQLPLQAFGAAIATSWHSAEWGWRECDGGAAYMA